ncbi:hypothetical protein V1389_01470 [Flavobacterium rakeshii]|uniref:hypothetical protein n=1 Tax=Flavobacterium rakeshii TaxID=1038845 RepID=UPI002E7C193C|nr:hypothetical protein [Flavobacterium rakeshii]MEE1896985.1 hypothetical protein [Flavobacterium rakeshii]
MYQIEREHEAIYEKLVPVVGFKFKTHLKGTDIIFKSFYKMHNILTDVEDYLLVIEGQKTIRFSSQEDFIRGFISVIKECVNDLNIEYRELNHRQQHDAIIDENEMFNRQEYIGYTGERLIKFLNVLREKLKKENNK